MKPATADYGLCLLQCARTGARCDYGIYLGASATNWSRLHRLSSQAIALKMYLNPTFTSLQLDTMEVWMKVSEYADIAFTCLGVTDVSTIYMWDHPYHLFYSIFKTGPRIT